MRECEAHAGRVPNLLRSVMTKALASINSLPADVRFLRMQLFKAVLCAHTFEAKAEPNSHAPHQDILPAMQDEGQLEGASPTHPSTPKPHPHPSPTHPHTPKPKPSTHTHAQPI